MEIFNFFASILGHLLWFLYTIFGNYGVAIIFFTLIVKALLFPTSLKQQRSMAGQAKMGEKQKELQKRCGNDKAKYNYELQKLYEKEGISPGGSCLTTLLPIPIMFSIYYSVIYPLQNTLHLDGENVRKATEFISKLPGVASTNFYVELEIIKNWDAFKDNMVNIFTGDEIAKIESFTQGFKFLGLDLLKTPQGAGFFEFLWLIPVASLLASVFMQLYMNKTSGVKQPGCMKYAMYLLPLLSAWWAFTFPAAVGLYWVISSLTGGFQSVIIHNFFSPAHMAAQKEASRFVLLEQNESKYKPLPLYQQNEVAKRIEERSQKIEQQQKDRANSQNGSKKKSGKTNKSNDYLGNKK